MMNKENLSPKVKRFKLSKNKLKVAVASGALVIGLGLRHLSKTPSRDVQETKKEQADTNTSKKDNSKTIRYDALPKITYNSAIKISTQQDIEKLFFMAEPLIIQELALEEVAQKHLYNDYGKFKDGVNTVGMGSTYSPLNVKNYNNPNATWFHIYSNPKSFSGFTTDYQKMRDLIVGWAMFRTKTQNYNTKEIETHKTVLARMFEKLQGATLNVHEFSAIFCAVYNNENNITELCPIIQKHHKNKLKCANTIRTWYSLPHMTKNAGTPDRAYFESLVFLNINNFCKSIPDMPTKPSAKASCINVQNIDRDKNFTFVNCVKTSDESKKSFLNVVYSKGAITPRTICSHIKFRKELYKPKKTNPLQAKYNKAISLFNKKDFKSSLSIFVQLEQTGIQNSNLLNDIAYTHFKLKNYDECITYCRKVLSNKRDTGQHAKAYYNAGLAYEGQGDNVRAVSNYKLALSSYIKYGISDEKNGKDYQKLYHSAINRIMMKDASSKLKPQSFAQKLVRYSMAQRAKNKK